MAQGWIGIAHGDEAMLPKGKIFQFIYEDLRVVLVAGAIQRGKGKVEQVRRSGLPRMGW